MYAQKGVAIIFIGKIYRLTVKNTRLSNLYKSLFLYSPNKTDVRSNEIGISNLLRIRSSIPRHKSFTRGH